MRADAPQTPTLESANPARAGTKPTPVLSRTRPRIRATERATLVDEELPHRAIEKLSVCRPDTR